MANTTYCVPGRPKNAKNGTLARQIIKPTELKLGMHTQPEPGSNMGWVLPS